MIDGSTLLRSVGLGIITYNAPSKIVLSAPSVPSGLGAFVIVNDGTPYPSGLYPGHAHVITHPENRSVGAAKNTALKFLMDSGVQHLFLMEDDVVINDPKVFENYVRLAEASGIEHFNYALQGPSNFRLTVYDRLRMSLFPGVRNRSFNESAAVPDVQAEVDYGAEGRMAIYRHCAGAFCYYSRRVIQTVGYNDPEFVNALEHIDHTYRIAKAGFHPPYGWFPDISRSNRYLSNIPNCMEMSTIAGMSGVSRNQSNALAYFLKKHGVTPRDLIRQAPMHKSAAEEFIKLHSRSQYKFIEGPL